MKTKATIPGKTQRRPRSGTITMTLTGLGTKTRTLRLPAGTTVKDIVMRHGLAQSSIRLNRRPVRLLTKLKTGDVLVAVPRSIVGGSAGRFDHFDLERYRQTMTADAFKFFTSFVGADRLGFRDEDLRPS